MTYVSCYIVNIRLHFQNSANSTKNCVQDKKSLMKELFFSSSFIHGYKPICYLVIYRVLHTPSVLRSGVRLMQLHQQKTKKDKLVTRVLREMKFFVFLSLTFNFDIKFQYIKTCIPSKIPGGGGRWVREGFGMDKIIGLYISPYLCFQ